MAAETPRGADEKFYAEVGKACAENDVRLTVYVAEAPRDRELIWECYNASPVQFCENNSLTGKTSVLAHMIHLDLEKDLDILVKTGTSVAHNPTSNCKLGDGIAPIPQMLEKGINVALGTDGGPCSNTYDLFRDMHLAGIIHKGNLIDASLLPAEQVLEMATINGARALGLDKEIGSLEVGKKADFIVVNPGALGAVPYDIKQIGKGGMHPSTAVVHSCSGRDVEIVVVDGKVLVQKGILLTLDEITVKNEAQEAISRIREKSGVAAQPLKRSWRYT
jgi:cytosine/adenosine deaminase-related metal-dependent hydrolase